MQRDPGSETERNFRRMLVTEKQTAFTKQHDRLARFPSECRSCRETCVANVRTDARRQNSIMKRRRSRSFFIACLMGTAVGSVLHAVSGSAWLRNCSGKLSARVPYRVQILTSPGAHECRVNVRPGLLVFSPIEHESRPNAHVSTRGQSEVHAVPLRSGT